MRGEALSDLPIIAQMTVGQDGNTSYGTSVETIAPKLTELGADVVGLNCSVGPAAMLDAIERMVERTDRPLSAQPNAGLPRAVDDRRIYLASPEYMGSYARRMIQAGARFVGGCCGTTPDTSGKFTPMWPACSRGSSDGPSGRRTRRGDRSRRGSDGRTLPAGTKARAGELVTTVKSCHPRAGTQRR